jgi:hypothetical protein
MRFTEKFIREMWDNLERMGLASACTVCGSNEAGSTDGQLIRRRARPVGDPTPRRPDANLEFLLRRECTACGHVSIFDVQRHRGPHEETIVPGGAEERP